MKDKRIANEQAIENQLKTVDTKLKDGVFVFTGPMTISEFAIAMEKSPNAIITHYFKQGKMFNINHTLNEEDIAELCLEWGFDFQKEAEVNASNFMDEVEITDKDEDLQGRPPIITIMGHVDHGKTTLIDKIRNSNITGSEAGGITQHTGAYQVEYAKKKITFLDTPGHEAFTEMRARGAKVTDIVVLVVAADDGVMPQTKEAIDHTKAAKVPMIVFVNKMDKVGADPEKVKGELSQADVVADDWGGDVQFIYGSALNGEGIDKLFEAINLESEMLELKANPNRHAIGTVVESRLDKGKGTVATLIVQKGTLLKRDFIVAGSNYGRVRSLENTVGEAIEKAGPGTPVVVTGLNYSPNAGDKFFGFENEKFAKNLANQKAFADKQNELKNRAAVVVQDGVKVLNIIIKSDVQGTAEAVKHSLAKLENDEAQVNIVRASVGGISKSDILLAQASNAIIYSFNIRPTADVKAFAEQEKVEIRPHSIIYKMIEEVEAMLKGLMAPKFEEKVIGEAQVLKVIPSSKIGNIAGSLVISGMIKAECKVRLIRDSKVIFEGVLDSLQRGPNAAKKVENGKDFGCHIKRYNDIKVDDIIEAYEDVEVEIK